MAWHGLPGPLGSTQHFGFHPRQLTLSHRRVAWSSRKRLIWRQHRGQALWTIITVTALCALMANFGLSAGHWHGQASPRSLAPARADLRPVAADDPGHIGQGLGR